MKDIQWQTPAIEGYGKIKFYPQSKHLPTNNHEYKLLFNIGSSKTKQGVNAALWRMARAINLFKVSGIDADQVNSLPLYMVKLTLWHSPMKSTRN